MKILHIGDIHLGCTLENQRRNGEIEKVFNHLAEYVKKTNTEAALLAGDVFDKGSPSNESQKLYYHFLARLQQAGCRQVVVIAGNHDSSNFMDAAQVLLEQMNIHVIGNISPENPEKEVIALGSEENPDAYVCAVPFLNERDVRMLSPEGEKASDHDAAVARGIEAHYRKVFQIADRKRNGRNIPVIGMGHLYASGCTFAASDDDSAAAVGNLNPVDLAACADGYAYMALGHLHKPQTVRNHDNWRYAGSILPMNLREHGFCPQVVLLDSQDPAHPVVHELPADCFHEMNVVRGDMNELRNRLSELDSTGREIWVKVIYTGSEIRPNWAIELRQEFREKKIQIVVSEVQRNIAGKPEDTEKQDSGKTLDRMTPEDLFRAYLTQKGEVTDPEQMNTYLNLFRSSMLKVYNPAEQKETEGSPVKRGIMRFERLYIKNVNSLYGENRIDFTAPEFNEGIFLISGNTGAGKSSILDAICLALYGATPRASVSNQKDCIMSEGTNEIQAELTFTLGENRYRACFQHQKTIRARNPFGQVIHRLYQNDVPVPGTAMTIKNRIEELIGMDKVQFCRCVLLAQGSFDAFLKAKSDERSAILKNITGTEIYSEIGRQIHEDYAKVKEQYELAKRTRDSITTLSDENLAKLLQQKEFLAAEIQTRSGELKNREAVESIFQSVELAQNDLQKAAENVNAAEKRRIEAEPRRLELENANRAINCEKSFLHLQDVRKQQQGLLKILTDLEAELPQLEKRSAELEQKRTEQEQKLTKLTEQLKTDQALFQEIRLLDNHIATGRKQYSIAEKELANAQTVLENSRKTFRTAEEKWNQARRKAEEAERYRGSHAEDEKLSQMKLAWDLRREQLIAETKRNDDDRRKLETIRTGLAKKRHELEENKQNLQKEREKLKVMAENLKKLQSSVDSLLQGKSLQDLREGLAAAMKLDELFRNSAQRSEYLTSGKPCPLCGSLQHPYCEGTPVPDSKDFENTAKVLDRDIRKIEAYQDEIRKTELNQSKSQAEVTAIQNRIEESEAVIIEEEKWEKEQTGIWHDHCCETTEKLTALTNELQKTLQVPWTDHSALPDVLDQRIRNFERARKISEALAAEKAGYDKAYAVYSTVNPQNEETLCKKQKEFSGLSSTLEKQELERRERFGLKNVDEEEKKIAANIEIRRKELNQTASEAINAQARTIRNKEDQQKYHLQQIELAAELQKVETGFMSVLKQYGFPAQDDFLAKRRDPHVIQVLTAEMQEIENHLNAGKGALAERRKILDDTQAKLPDGADRESNLQQLQQIRILTGELQNKFNETIVNLGQDEIARKKSEIEKKRVAELELAYNNWKYLDDKFGSSSVDRFGRIAQGYTFRELLHFANNNRLRSLQKHFTLINDINDPLELNVVDHFRGDQVRTSRNLSGGESFEVSLALALGLAEMSAISQNASLGNVLLDEGFGTLDDDALESALDLLMQLKRTDRKLVGIISHVAKLKERIHTQIEVTSSGGMGSLSGAGVAEI